MQPLPRGWQWATIGDVAEVNPPMSKVGLADDDVVSFVPMAAVEEQTGRLDPSDTRQVGDLRTKTYRQFLEGDLLVAKITPSMENGKAAIAQGLESGRGFGSTEFHIIRPLGPVSAKYLLYFVLAQQFRTDAARHLTGTAGQLRVPPDYLRRHPLPVPPPQEQRRIVAAIEEHLSRLDVAIRALSDLLPKLSHLREGLLRGAFDPAWERVPLATLTDPERVIRYGILKPGPDVPGGVPVIKVRDYPNGIIHVDSLKRTTPEISAKYQRAAVRSGDILISIRGTYGRVATVPEALDGANITQDSARVAPLPSVHRGFLLHFLRSPECQSHLERIARGVAVKGVNLRDLRELPTPLPDLATQAAVANALDYQLSVYDQLLAELNRAQRASDILRNSILAAAYSGHLVQQDPEDEPSPILPRRSGNKHGPAAAPRASTKGTAW